MIIDTVSDENCIDDQGTDHCMLKGMVLKGVVLYTCIFRWRHNLFFIPKAKQNNSLGFQTLPTSS